MTQFYPVERCSVFFLWPLTAFVAVALWACLHRWQQRGSKDPKTWPFLGSYLEASRNWHHFHDWLFTYFSDKHRTFRLKLFSSCVYFTVDPANVEHILKTNFQNYPKGERLRSRLHDFLGDGIFNADGNIWKRHRKVASVQFSNRKLRDFSTIAFRQDALKLVEVLDTAAKFQQAIDIHDLLLRMTLDSICKVGFGVDIGSLARSLAVVPFGKSFDTANDIITSRLVNPIWQLQKSLNLGQEKILKQELTTLDTFTSDIIQRRKEEIINAASLNSESEMREDLLSKFILFNSGELGAYSDEELRDSVLNFVLAGRDTTAVTLAWFIYCICKQPEVGERVLEETRGVLGLESTKEYSFAEVAERLTYESLSKMEYLQAALTETMRLYPPVPRDSKSTLNDDTLPDGTRVKRGDFVAYVPYSMGRMEFLWGKDALNYNPDRWLKDGVFQPESPFKFSAFQAGPRICLGKESAYLQMKLTVALLLHFFRFSMVPKHVVHYRLMLVMTMVNGLLVHVSQR